MTPAVKRLLLGGSAVDPDAAAWFAAVVAAGSSVSTGNRRAVNAFVAGCKADGTWAAIKACCLLCAADSLTGALVPLKGVAPVNVNFVSGDYSRVTGLKGDGATKRLNSGRMGSADPQDNNHLAVWITEADGIANAGMISGNSIGTTNQRRLWSTTVNNNTATSTSVTQQLGFHGISRSNGTGYTYRGGGSNTAVAVASTGVSALELAIYSRNVVGTNWSSARLSLYSIGEALDLALLDARLTTLMASLT